MGNNDEKIYNLLEKVYVELQDTKNELHDTKNELHDTKNEFNTRLTKIEVTLENIVVPNFKTLFETQTQILTKLEEHDKRFDSIEKKLEKHDVEIRVIKGGNKKVK